MADGSMVKDHLHMALSASGAGGGDGLPILCEAEARADQRREVHGWGEAERELETFDLLSPVLLYPVGVGACEGHLLVPQRREVEAAARGGHPHEDDLAVGPGEPHGVLHRSRGSDALEGLVRAAHDDGLAYLRSVRLGAEHGG